MKVDPVDLWLKNVAYSHSKNDNTQKSYRLSLERFCKFAECTSQEINGDYERLTEKQFKHKWSQIVKAYISHLSTTELTTSTVSCRVAAVKSFFKYNDLPLGFIPVANKKIMFHNRDITKQEIVEVIKLSGVRDRAFFTMMAQSGQRPHTLVKLKRKHIEPDFSKGILPCCIRVPEELAKGQFGSFFTFMGEESVDRLKSWFKKRGMVGPEDYIFTKQGTDEPVSRASPSFLFSVALEKLKKAGTIEFEQQQPGKPRELRLYSLRNHFRREAGKAGIQYVNFWMGHRANYDAPHIPASDEHYSSRDVEFHRAIYMEKAMPFLRLESRTPTEMEQVIKRQAERIEELERKQDALYGFLEFWRDPVKRRKLKEIMEE